MKQSVSCEIVRDLLPSYIENLSSEKSAEEIKAHLETCRECRALYHEMTSSEPQPDEQQPEIEYFKKVNHSRRRVAIIAICAVLGVGLVAGAVTALLGFRANSLSVENEQLSETVSQLSEEAERPSVVYNPETKALIVSGTKDYDRIEIPEEASGAVTLDVQDDDFHLSVYLPLLRGASESPDTFLPAYISRTKLGLRFVREYLKEHAGNVYPASGANKMIDLTIRKDSGYTYLRQADRIEIYLGSNYWHREYFYLLALMNCKEIEWEQIGYALYVNMTLNPYNEMLAMSETLDKTDPDYQMLINAGADPEFVTLDTLRIQNDVTSRRCFERGLTKWGSAFECAPVKEVLPFTKTARTLENEANSELSPMMAASFIAWLSDRYGFETVSAFCFGKTTFEEAFGSDYRSAFDAWKAWIIETYPID